MPLPMPNLDTRRWADLVDEGRALIPRHASSWTDQNYSDPGITLIELLASLVEQEMYRLNRVSPRHRRKLLGLAGFPPRPPRAAQAALTFRWEAFDDRQELPEGVTVTMGGAESPPIRFRTRTRLTLTRARLRAVQQFDGAGYVDRTRAWQDGEPFTALGDDPRPPDPAEPARAPALYLGFDAELSTTGPVSLWLRFRGEHSGRHERERIEHPDRHHAARIAWEYFDGQWRTLAGGAEGVEDETRSLTLDGAVRVSVPTPMKAVAVGASPDERFYLRARLVDGSPDTAPVLAGVRVNTVGAVQSIPVRGVFTIAPGVVPRGGNAPARGASGKLWLALGGDGVITGLEIGPDLDGPHVEVLDYQPATLATSGRVVLSLALAGVADGSPGCEALLSEAPVEDGEVDVWTIGPAGSERWLARADLDASGRADAHVMLDPASGELRFGDGERGRVPPAGAAILAGYRATAGAAGNLPPGRNGRVDRHAAGLAEHPDHPADAVTDGPSVGGADRETLVAAAGRAAETLWAHERLVELLEAGTGATLDQVDRAAVLARAAPTRATTLADYERLALDVPGTVIRRARAWAGLDPRYPGLRAPGTVAVVVVPELPRGEPRPERGLLRAVHAYLDRRRIVGTRLVVVGPRYVSVRVLATVRARVGADPDRVRSEIVARLDAFLDPLTGGPNGQGWPFGRDVYRSEVLQAIDDVPGVDHVLVLSMVGSGGAEQCGNLCVGPTELTTSGDHAVEVPRP